MSKQAMELALTIEQRDLLVAILRGYPPSIARNDALSTLTALKEAIKQHEKERFDSVTANITLEEIRADMMRKGESQE